MLKKFLLICFALLTVSVYAEGILYCRSGKITAAQLTTAKINIAKLPPELLQQFPPIGGGIDQLGGIALHQVLGMYIEC